MRDVGESDDEPDNLVKTSLLPFTACLAKLFPKRRDILLIDNLCDFSCINL